MGYKSEYVAATENKIFSIQRPIDFSLSPLYEEKLRVLTVASCSRLITKVWGNRPEETQQLS